MGVWGFGPFDSDAALDTLDAIFDDTGTLSAAEISAALGSHMHSRDAHIRYACAGLVAAALDGVEAEAGTSLLSVDVGGTDTHTLLGYHCGYANLLPTRQAETLAGQARDVLDALSTDGDWHNTYLEPAQVRAAVTAIAETLKGR